MAERPGATSSLAPGAARGSGPWWSGRLVTSSCCTSQRSQLRRRGRCDGQGHRATAVRTRPLGHLGPWVQMHRRQSTVATGIQVYSAILTLPGNVEATRIPTGSLVRSCRKELT
jgi:hypothetical protein